MKKDRLLTIENDACNQILEKNEILTDQIEDGLNSQRNRPMV